ncbi:MAG: hypothetical protein HYY35_03855 [Deltaproteobacteria bacterium]|nr:hypothetical protein [Deltaproteobacteria bacterium]
MLASPDSSVSESRRGSRLDLAAGSILILAIAAAYLSQAVLFHRYVNDDAFITFRYSRSWASGRGPYYNPGEHVEGYTNFLWMVVLTPVIRFGGAAAAWPAAKLIGFLCGAACIALAFGIVRRLACEDASIASRAELPALLAAGLLAVNPAHALNAMSGLETLLYGAALTAGVWLDLSSARGRWRGAGFAFAAAALTRPEGAFIFAVYACSAFVVRRFVRAAAAERRPPLRTVDVAIVALAVWAQLGFRAGYYDGELLPNTFFAKTGGFAGYDATAYVRDGLWCAFFGLSGMAAGAWGWCSRPGGRALAAPPFAAAMAGALLPLVVGADWMMGWRLMVPYVPVLAGIVCLGWAKVCLPWMLRHAAWTSVAMVGVLPLLWVVQRPARSSFFDVVTVDADNWSSGYGRVAETLCAGSSSQTVAMMDIGQVGYRCFDRRILDITGLTDRFIARSPGAFLEKEFDPDYLIRQDPEYVVIRLIERPDSSDPRRLVIAPYTRIEDRLYRDSTFARRYRRPRGEVVPAEPMQRQLIARSGAFLVFPHWGPDGRGYLLVFRRRESVDRGN